jgi:hypothetical protein
MSRASRSATLALLAAVLLAPWSAAHAATLQLVLDKPSYHPGETVTMTLLGDSQGATDMTLFAAILRPDPSVLFDLDLQLFAPPSSDGVPWTIGAQLAPVCGPNPRECWLINMIHVGAGPVALPVGVDAALEPFTYAVLTGTAGAPGAHLIEFGTSRFAVGSGAPLPSAGVNDFFGLKIGRAPAATLVIVNPEPGTAALLALGLGGLAATRRRSRS